MKTFLKKSLRFLIALLLPVTAMAQHGGGPPPIPPAPIHDTNICGPKMLHWGLDPETGDPADPPNGVVWYWQTAPDGEVKISTNHSRDYQANTTGTYYLKAYVPSDNIWSEGSTSVSVVIDEVELATATEAHHCGYTTLLAGTPSSGIIWYWQTDPLGTSKTNSSDTLHVPISGSGSQYFIRAWDNVNGCWSPFSGINQPTVYSAGNATASPSSQTIFDGQKTSVALSSPDNVTGYSFTASGTNTNPLTGTGYSIHQTLTLNAGVTSGTATYIVTAQSLTPEQQLCSGAPFEVDVNVYQLPAVTAPSHRLSVSGLTLSVQAIYDSYRWHNVTSGGDLGSSSTQLVTSADSYTVTVTKDGTSVTSKPFAVFSSDYGTTANYVRSNVTQVSGITAESQLSSLTENQLMQSTAYFDGLGRPLQTVSTKASPAHKDFVQPNVYDEFGREAQKYLPFAATGTADGSLKPDVITTTGSYAGAAQNFYNTPSSKVAVDTRYNTQTTFEPSPLNRPTTDLGTGQNWVDNNKTITHNYLMNADGTGTGQEHIIAWIVSSGALVKAPAVTGSVLTGGYYANGQISIKVTTDEEGHGVREYTDKLGHVILKKVQAVAGSTDLNNLDQWTSTYYVFDDFGNLAFVLPPEAVKALNAQQ